MDGLSIGFRTRRATGGPGGGAGRPGSAGAAPPARRRLVEIDLWEISVVTFPMQERARVLEWRAFDRSLAGLMRAGAGRFAAAAGRP